MPGYAPGAASAALLRLAEELPEDRPTLGDALNALGRAGLGIALLALALPSFLPVPGLPTGIVFGTALALVAVQVMLGARRLTFPGWLRRRPLPREAVVAGVRWLAPRLGAVEARLRPRLVPLTGRRARAWLGLPILLLALLIVLPIPLGNQLPALAVVAFAFGLLARDGAAVLVGLALAVLGLAWNTAVLLLSAELLAYLV